MSLLSSLQSSLPTFGTGSVSDSLINNTSSDVSTAFSESMSKIESSYGDLNSFTGLSGASASFSTISSQFSTGTLSSTYSSVGSSVASMSASVSQVSATAVNASSGNAATNLTAHKVKLVSAASNGAMASITTNVDFPIEPFTQDIVEFDNMPQVAERRNADYEAISPPQMIGEFQKFKGTKSTAWQITAKFTCRTSEEAKRNFIMLNTLRGWVMPYFGEKQRVQFQNKLGAPPPIVMFSGWRGVVGEVPTVVTGLNWTWPTDVDWIPTSIKDADGEFIPFPTVMDVNIDLIESFSPLQFNGFDLVAFRNGDMMNAFREATSSNSYVAESSTTTTTSSTSSVVTTSDGSTVTVESATTSASSTSETTSNTGLASRADAIKKLSAEYGMDVSITPI